MGVCDEVLGVSLGETAPSADLGGGSTYSNENFEDPFMLNRMTGI